MRTDQQNIDRLSLHRPARLWTRLIWGCCCVWAALASATADDDSTTHWSFRPLRRAALPTVDDREWVRTPVDAFVLARLEQAGLSPATPAKRIAWLRRVTFDLIGLPPTPEEAKAYLSDTSRDADLTVVDRLLASPRYGERWAQHWLDVVRYADSDGYEYDDPRTEAWRYRDWVIRAFNEDKPYNEFVMEQIAGDEVRPQDHGAVAATGFHRLGPLRLSAGNQDEEKNRQELLVEMTDALGSAFLGLTIGCARCHDHKFDDITQAEYFSLQAHFAATQPVQIPLASKPEQEAHALEVAAWKKSLEEKEKELADLDKAVRARIAERRRTELPENVRSALAVKDSDRNEAQKSLVATAAEKLEITEDDIRRSLNPDERTRRESLQKSLESHQREKPKPLPAIRAVTEKEGTVPATFVLQRGMPGKHLQQVQPRFPAVLTWDSPAADARDENSAPAQQTRRTALARWMASDRNPLTGRVIVNRLWQHHFGRGLVATPDDFGVMGDLPSHPELLDWLACELVARGWSLKEMHRLIVNSATYRQSTVNEAAQRSDPENQLWGRMLPRRLDAGQLRDAVLAVSGTLNHEAGGPGVFVPLAKEVTDQIYKGDWTPTADASEHDRRTIYLFVKRNVRPPLLEAFDAPGTLLACAQRQNSTHVGQALATLNGPFMNAQAARFAARLIKETQAKSAASADVDLLTERAYQLAFSRAPTDKEKKIARRFLAEQRQLPRASRAALTDYCLAILNLDEFLYLK